MTDSIFPITLGSQSLILFYSIPLLICLTADRIYTTKALKQHQEEWDRISESTPDEKVYDAYNDYTHYLMMTRHPMFGACLPSMSKKDLQRGRRMWIRYPDGRVEETNEYRFRLEHPEPFQNEN